MKKLTCFILLVVLSLGIIGCNASIFGPIGAGVSATVNAYVYWKDGEAHAYYNYDAEIMHKATLRALKKLNLPVTEDKVEPAKKTRKGTIPGHHLIATSNDKFKIKIFSTEKDISKVSIRVNFMGDKNYTLLIYSKIEDQLNVVTFK